MNSYSRLTADDMFMALKTFGINSFDSYELLKGGSENTNYQVLVGQDKFVLCICEQKSEKETEELALLLNHFDAHGFITSKVLPTTEGHLISTWDGKPMMLRSFLEGKIVKDLNSHQLGLIGQQMARMHRIKPPDFLPTQLNYGKEHFDSVKEYAPDSEMVGWLDKVMNHLKPYLELDLPRTLIHSDIFWDNVIIDRDDNTATIMDFEEAANYYRVFDIGMAIIGTCAKEKSIDLHKAKHLLSGYQSVSNLSLDEVNSLKAFTIYAGASMTLWRHKTFNLIKPDPNRFDHYLGLKVLVDFLFDQKEDCFLNS